MSAERTVLVIPGSGGCWHLPHQLFAADAARSGGARLHHVVMARRGATRAGGAGTVGGRADNDGAGAWASR